MQTYDIKVILILQPAGSSTYYVALALPWTLTVMRGIQVPRNSKAACMDRFPLTPPVPGPPCAAPWVPEPELPGQKIRE